MVDKTKKLRDQLKKQLHSILDEGYRKRKKASTAEDRQKILLWEMNRIRHAYDGYRKEISMLIEEEQVEPEKRKLKKAKKPKKEPTWTDKKPSEKTKKF
ncbi:MAG: hypothetical protein ACE5J7_01410 [Candidatus Aenigmatarchaeota archaeon]